MTTTYEPSNKEILTNCLEIMSKPIRVIKDSHSIGYLNNRKAIDQKEEANELDVAINDEAYYNELSKDF